MSPRPPVGTTTTTREREEERRVTRGKSKVTWEEPPTKSDRRYDWADIAGQLRENPRKWAKIFEGDRASLATAIRINGIKALSPRKGFEVRTTNNVRGNPRTCDMYLRYVPEKDRGDEA